MATVTSQLLLRKDVVRKVAQSDPDPDAQANVEEAEADEVKRWCDS